MVRACLPSGQILRSRPLPPTSNPTPVARVSGRASPARLRRPQLFGSSSCRKFPTSLYTPWTSSEIRLHVLRCPPELRLPEDRARQGRLYILGHSVAGSKSGHIRI
ncbi:hypothetical protein VPH35_109127 [Triticum aestivum]